ncbi:hypothetical protein C8Q77DRAFT_1157323 [Trametes polyzona]|nr:hypothetical protein C8Q77DRAFT_1157323 [Trametes polyzona]
MGLPEFAISNPSSITVQFKPASSISILAKLAAAVPSAIATQCYSQGGCQSCETRGSIESARDSFCGSDKWQHSSSLTRGWAHITLYGRFAEQRQCVQGFDGVLDACYGSKEGGIWTYDFSGDSAPLDISFCNCE